MRLGVPPSRVETGTSIYNKSQLTEALNDAQMYCEYGIKSNEWYEQVNRILSEYV